MCCIELSTFFNFIPFPSGFPKHTAIFFWSLVCDSAHQCVHVCARVCVHTCILLAMHVYAWMNSLHHYPINTKAHHRQIKCTHPNLSEWWIAPMFKVIDIMLLLTSLTSCCTSTTTTYLNLPSRKSNSVSVNSPNPTPTPKAHRIIALDAS